jgi:hypothetical protein
MFVKAPHVRVFSEALEIAAQALFRSEPKYALSLMFRLCNRDFMSRMFDRVTVALLSQDLVTHAFELCAAALEAASIHQITSEDHGLGIAVVAPACELVSRLWFRLQDSAIPTARRLVIAIYHLNHRTIIDSDLSQATRLLFRRAFQAMSTEQILEWIPDLLLTPLPVSREERWIPLLDPFEEIPLPDLLTRNTTTIRSEADNDAIAALLRAAWDRGTLRAPAVHRLARLHALGFMNQQEAREFGSALWSRVNLNQLPLIEGYLFNAFLHLPAPDSINTSEVIKQVLMHSAIPHMVRDDHGQSVTSSDLVKDATDFLDGFERCSAPILRIHTHSYGIRWSIEECDTLLDKLATWAAFNVTDRNRHHNIAMPAIRSLYRFVARTIVPTVSCEQAVLSKAVQLLRSIAGTEHSPLEVRVVDLIVGDIDATQLREMLVAPFYSSGEDDEVLQAGHGLLLWLSYNFNDIVEYRPNSFIEEILTCMLARRGTPLRYCIETVSMVVRFFPTALGEHDDLLIRRVLRALLSLSTLPTSPPIEPPARAASRETVGIRTAAAKLASELYRLCVSQHRQVPDILESWRVLAQRDVLPEVQHAWRRVRGANSAEPG